MNRLYVLMHVRQAVRPIHSIVNIMENVVYGLYQQVLRKQHLNYGAAVVVAQDILVYVVIIRKYTVAVVDML
jgi:hypothetical protein